MDLQLRRAHSEDFALIGALTTSAYVVDDLIAPDAAYLGFLGDVASRDREGEVWVATDERGSILGAVTFVAPGSAMCEVARGREAEMRCLAVDPMARRAGIGEALTRLAVDRAREEGCEAMVLCSSTRMAAAHRLYARLGFQRLPERDWSPNPSVELLAYILPLPLPDILPLPPP